jgi:hypothetical protein
VLHFVALLSNMRVLQLFTLAVKAPTATCRHATLSLAVLCHVLQNNFKLATLEKSHHAC